MQLVPLPAPTQGWLVDAHVGLALVAAAAGAGALAVPWGSPLHRRWGRAAALSLVLSTALLLWGVQMSPVTFWTGCAVPWLVWRGLWWIGRARGGATLWATGGVLVVGSVPWAGWVASRGDPGQAVGILLFASFVAWMWRRDLRTPGPQAASDRERRQEHLSGMVGALTLLWQNFLPRRLHAILDFLPGLFTGILPVLVGALLIAWLRRRVTDPAPQADGQGSG